MIMKLIEKPVKKSELKEIAKERFGDLVKAVVDIEKGIMMVGAELHCDEEYSLLEEGSEQQHLWGINIYPDKSKEELVEFNPSCSLRLLISWL